MFDVIHPPFTITINQTYNRIQHRLLYICIHVAAAPETTANVLELQYSNPSDYIIQPTHAPRDVQIQQTISLFGWNVNAAPETTANVLELQYSNPSDYIIQPTHAPRDVHIQQTISLFGWNVGQSWK